MSYGKKISIIFTLLLLMTTLVRASITGGNLAGTVTDPKGSVIAGATVTVLDAAGNQVHAPVTTNDQGRFKLEGLPAGTYVLVFKAAGFKEARREQVRIEEGKSATTDVRLEIA